MKSIVPAILFLLLPGMLCSFSRNKNRPVRHIAVTEKIIYYRLGSKTLQLKVTRYGSTPGPLFISLHDNEHTSVEAARKFLSQSHGTLIEIENEGERNISFRYEGRPYSFDPNCLFSAEGIRRHLVKNNSLQEGVAGEMERLGRRILDLIPGDAAFIIALHNNSDGDFGILSYRNGNELAAEAAAVYINPAEDTDNFFLTTSELIFREIKKEKLNIVLQDNTHCTEDGSLSVYAGKNHLPYVNLETEHDQPHRYYSMLLVLAKHLITKEE